MSAGGASDTVDDVRPSMEELQADDDLLSSMLLECVGVCAVRSHSSLEFEPAIVTHKMNPSFRPMRFDREAVTQLVRRHVVWEGNVPAALTSFLAYVVSTCLLYTSPSPRD